MPNFQAFETVDATNKTVNPGANVTGTTTYYGNAVGGSGTSQSIHLRWTGTPTGTFTIWYSDKKDPVLTTDADWVQDTSSTLANPAGAAGSTLMDTTNSNAKLRRVKYVNASGVGFVSGEIMTRGY
jgi:hypothetical protein